MSHIRPLSNPEGLYIFDLVDGRVEIYGEFTLPKYVFKGLLSRWLRKRADVRYYGARLVEDQKRFQWRLYWRRRYVEAYEVTWFYVATSICGARS